MGYIANPCNKNTKAEISNGQGVIQLDSLASVFIKNEPPHVPLIGKLWQFASDKIWILEGKIRIVENPFISIPQFRLFWMRLVVALTTVIGCDSHACNPIFERRRQEDWQEFSRLYFPGKSTRLAWAAQQDHSSKNQTKKIIYCITYYAIIKKNQHLENLWNLQAMISSKWRIQEHIMSLMLKHTLRHKSI